MKRSLRPMKWHGVLIGALLLAGPTSVWAQNTFPASGNVGIGTASPLAPLSIRATGSTELIGQTTNLNAAETFRFGVRAAGDAGDTYRNAILLGTTVGSGGSDSYISFETNRYGV